MPKVKRPVSVSELICDALLRLIKRGRPYAEITIQEIADEAGACRNSFYRNCSSKADISAKDYDTYACCVWIGIVVITEWFLRDCDIPIEELVEIVRSHRL